MIQQGRYRNTVEVSFISIQFKYVINKLVTQKVKKLQYVLFYFITFLVMTRERDTRGSNQKENNS